jgi:hypothetical protein
MKLKSLLIIIVTLILGILLGVLGSGYFRSKKMKQVRSYTSVEAFTSRFLKVLEPTEDQKQQIVPIIKKFSKENDKLRKKYRDDFRKLMKDFRDELYPLLTEEQIKRLEEYKPKRRSDDDKRGSRGDGRPDDHDHRHYPPPPMSW